MNKKNIPKGLGSPAKEVDLVEFDNADLTKKIKLLENKIFYTKLIKKKFMKVLFTYWF